MSSTQTHAHLLLALRRVLRSLSRLLIRVGIHFDEFAALAQVTFVESAIRDFEHPGIPSRERIAAVTGLTRHQVDQYIGTNGAQPSADPTTADLLVEILHKWHTTPEYVGPYGIPLELEFSTPPDRCFCSLVTLVDSKVNPGRALKEMQLAGAVTPSGQKRFRPISRSLLVSAPTSPQLIEHFGMTVWRLAQTLVHNIESRNTDKRLQRRVSTDRGLPVEFVPEFESYVRSKAAELLLDLDNWLGSQALDESNTGERRDVGVDIFLYMEPSTVEEPLVTLVDDSGRTVGVNGY